MSKKRRTRQQKIIAQLKRKTQLTPNIRAKSQEKMKLYGLTPVVSSPPASAELKSAGAEVFRILPRQRQSLLHRWIKPVTEKTDTINKLSRANRPRYSQPTDLTSLFFTSSTLIKKDLIKTTTISLLFLIGILVIWFLI